MAPAPARKVTHSERAASASVPMATPMTSCATVPTTISLSAVETLNQIASRVATSARPTQIAATNHTVSIRGPLGPASVSGRAKA